MQHADFQPTYLGINIPKELGIDIPQIDFGINIPLDLGIDIPPVDWEKLNLNLDEISKEIGITKEVILKQLKKPELPKLNKKLVKKIRSLKSADDCYKVSHKYKHDTPGEKLLFLLFLLIWISLCQNTLEIKLLDGKCLLQVPIHTLFLLKWISLCQTSRDIEEVKGRIPHADSQEMRALMAKHVSLLLKNVKK